MGDVVNLKRFREATEVRPEINDQHGQPKKKSDKNSEPRLVKASEVRIIVPRKNNWFSHRVAVSNAARAFVEDARKKSSDMVGKPMRVSLAHVYNAKTVSHAECAILANTFGARLSTSEEFISFIVTLNGREDRLEFPIFSSGTECFDEFGNRHGLVYRKGVGKLSDRVDLEFVERIRHDWLLLIAYERIVTVKQGTS